MAEVVRVVGRDAATFLQGQLSQDIDAIAVGGHAWSFVLEPDGHVVALVGVARPADDSFELVVGDGLGEVVEARLRKFLLRTKADISREPGDADPDEATRIRRGELGRDDIDERTVPAETGWNARAVSFTKGCYTGQELVARMDSRVADPPRRLVRLMVSDAHIGRAAPIVVDDVEVGAVTSAAPVGDAAVALGYVKRGSRTEGAAVVGGIEAMIEGPLGA